jgi:hypothetical protein
MKELTSGWTSHKNNSRGERRKRWKMEVAKEDWMLGRALNLTQEENHEK